MMTCGTPYKYAIRNGEELDVDSEADDQRKETFHVVISQDDSQPGNTVLCKLWTGTKRVRDYLMKCAKGLVEELRWMARPLGQFPRLMSGLSRSASPS